MLPMLVASLKTQSAQAMQQIHIGHLAFVDSRPMHSDIVVESVYRIFTARAGAEIELSRALQRLGGTSAAALALN